MIGTRPSHLWFWQEALTIINQLLFQTHLHFLTFWPFRQCFPFIFAFWWPFFEHLLLLKCFRWRLSRPFDTFFCARDGQPLPLAGKMLPGCPTPRPPSSTGEGCWVGSWRTGEVLHIDLTMQPHDNDSVAYVMECTTKLTSLPLPFFPLTPPLVTCARHRSHRTHSKGLPRTSRLIH